MSIQFSLNGSLLHDEVFNLLQKHSRFAMSQWLTDVLTDYLKVSDDESRCRLLSFAWATSILFAPEQLHHIANALSCVSSTSDIGIDTALQNACRAKIAIAESRISAHNTHWIRAVRILDDLPDFSPQGFQLAQVRLDQYLSSNGS